MGVGAGLAGQARSGGVWLWIRTLDSSSANVTFRQDWQ